MAFSGQLLVTQRRSLLEFDFAAIPAGSVINRAELVLLQRSATGNAPLAIDRLDQPWVGSAGNLAHSAGGHRNYFWSDVTAGQGR